MHLLAEGPLSAEAEALAPGCPTSFMEGKCGVFFQEVATAESLTVSEVLQLSTL